MTKGIVLLVWLGAALAGQWDPRLRKFMAYAGAICALVHVGALAGGKLEALLRTQSRDGLDAPILGFVAGAVLGAVLGVPLGALCVRSRVAYVIASLTAAAFLAFLPLVRI